MQNVKLKITEQNVKFDIKIRSYKYALEVIKLIDSLTNSSTTKNTWGPLLKCDSIGANIIEAQAASSRKDFKNFQSCSKIG